MTTFVIDASVALKWVVAEPDSSAALMLRHRARLLAPELLVAECANILWKKVRRRDLLEEEAWVAARLLQRSNVELQSMEASLTEATRLAITLGHPAYDCFYLALALERDCPFVTADERFARRLAQQADQRYHGRILTLPQAAMALGSKIN